MSLLTELEFLTGDHSTNIPHLRCWGPGKKRHGDKAASRVWGLDSGCERGANLFRNRDPFSLTFTY